jgi:acyl-CoA synthetase (NDP forming)
LREFLPAVASVTNPVDMIASAGPDEFRRATEIILSADETDAVIVLYIDVALAERAAIAQSITSGIAAARKQGATQKPVYACIMASAQPPKPLSGNGELVCNFAFPETPARVLSMLCAYTDWRNRPEGIIPEFDDIQPSTGRSLCQTILQERGSSWLSSEEIRGLFTAFALPLASGGFCRTADQAAQKAREIGFPVVVKLASKSIVHKTEIGGVLLNLADEDAVRRSFTTIQTRLANENKLDAMDGVLVQPMFSGGVEIMVGITLDPSFGPLIGFGLGGIHVEILRDVCFRVTPISDEDAKEMVRGIRGYPLLQGYRGHPPADLVAIEELLLRVARLAEEVPEISEIDLNPVVAFPPGQGCFIVDARVRVSS